VCHVADVVNVGVVISRWSLASWVASYQFPEKDGIDGELSDGGIAAIWRWGAAAILAD